MSNKGSIPNRTYTEDFKRNSIQLATDLGSFSAAGKQLGICPSNIRSWNKSMSKNNTAIKVKSDTIDISEYHRLLKENKRLLMEVEILKKATAYFAANQLK